MGSAPTAGHIQTDGEAAQDKGGRPALLGVAVPDMAAVEVLVGDRQTGYGDQMEPEAIQRLLAKVVHALVCLEFIQAETFRSHSPLVFVIPAPYESLRTGPDIPGLNPPRKTPRPGDVRPKTHGSAPTCS